MPCTPQMTTNADGQVGWTSAAGMMLTLGEALAQADPSRWDGMYRRHHQTVAELAEHRDVAYEREFQGEVDELSDLAHVDGGDRVGLCVDCLTRPGRHAPELDATVAELVAELVDVHQHFDVTVTLQPRLG